MQEIRQLFPVSVVSVANSIVSVSVLYRDSYKSYLLFFKNVSKNRSQAKFINHNISSIKVKTLNLGTLQNKYNRRGLNLKAC